MLFISIGDNLRSETELGLKFDEFHMLRQFALLLHLFQISIVLGFILGIGDLDHVLIEQTHEFWFLQ